MASEFLQKLGLTPAEQKKLAGLCASSPAALLAMRSAAQKDFEDLFGKDRADEIAARLESQLTPEDRQRLVSAPPARRYPLGAMLGTPPSELPTPKFDIEERDRLFNELQSLRNLPSPSADQKDRLAELEARLNELLESR